MASAYCPDCDETFDLSARARLGQRLTCPHCGADLKVLGGDPPESDWVYEWSYDEDETEW